MIWLLMYDVYANIVQFMSWCTNTLVMTMTQVYCPPLVDYQHLLVFLQ